jgi:catechol 2,3-dioxygenase-like lactoylglutathione lyase family enzyme
LIACLSALVASTGTARAREETTFEAVDLNHIALDVTDISRSRDFYMKHLGLAVTQESQSNCFLSFGSNFLALFRSPKAGMNHYCYSIKDYSVTQAAEKLKAEGIEPDIQGNRIYFPDPDGLTVQLASVDHRA